MDKTTGERARGGSLRMGMAAAGALALLAAGAAQAQSNVTIYGIIDTECDRLRRLIDEDRIPDSAFIGEVEELKRQAMAHEAVGFTLDIDGRRVDNRHASIKAIRAEFGAAFAASMVSSESFCITSWGSRPMRTNLKPCFVENRSWLPRSCGEMPSTWASSSLNESNPSL